MRDVIDGLSQTVAVGERQMRNSTGAIWIRNVSLLGPGMFDCNNDPPFFPVFCDQWSVLGVTGGGDPLNAPDELVGCDSPFTPSKNCGFNSLHDGGAQFGIADGSVRFVGDSIDGTVYANLASIADGQVISDF